MATAVTLDIPTAEWAEPLLEPRRYKGAKGGRSRGGSHFFAEAAVEEMLCDPQLHFVCIREVQRSLRYSAKRLVEAKIRSLGLSGHFEILHNEIRRVGGTGVMIFEGMQDHTAESIKSLEGFGRAWIEEARSLSQRSIELLIPTLRTDGSELWFSWNPEDQTDPVEKLFRELAGDAYPEHTGSALGATFAVVHATYLDNPFCPQTMIAEAERMRSIDMDAYEHIWLGGYNRKSNSKVLAGRYVVEEFEVQEGWGGPYHGCDHGFAQDPRTLVRCWLGEHRVHGPNCLYIEFESYEVGLSIDRTAQRWAKDVPEFARYTVRADSAEPGTNDYLRRFGVPKITGVDKWKGSLEDGIAYLQQFDKIVIHPRCEHAAEEARLYSYKVDRHTGDVLPDIEDRHNHIWDAVRYALTPLIKPGKKAAFASW